MAQDKLCIESWRGVFRICWLIAETGEAGAFLGDYLSRGSPPDCGDDHFVTTEAARAAGAEYDDEGLLWESQSAVRKALTAANAALKAHRSAKPWPEWAKQALVAGWKAPKGWQP